MVPKTRGGHVKRTKKGSSSTQHAVSSSTHILPPPPHYGNPPFHSLLVDKDAVDRYKKFCEKEFVVMHSLSSSFINSLHIDKLHDLLSAQPMFKAIVDHESQIYPSMVTQFFANLRLHTPNHNTLLSHVNNVEIKLNPTLINHIFHTTLPSLNPATRYWDTSRQWPPQSSVFDLSTLQAMFHTTETEAKHFNPTNLAPEDRVLYHILVNFVNPVAGNFTSPGKVPLVYFYFFIHKIPIDWGFVMHSRLTDLLSDTRRSFPHAQFLTDIFKHFKAPSNREPGITPHPFDMAILNKKGIRLVEGKWITRADFRSSIVPPSSQPSSSIPSGSSSSSSNPEIRALQDAVTRNTQHLRYIEFGLGMLMSSEDREYFQDARYAFGIATEDDDDDTDDDAEPSFLDSLEDSYTDSGDVPLSHFKKSKGGE